MQENQSLFEALSNNISYHIGEYVPDNDKKVSYLWQRDGLYYILENDLGTFTIKLYDGEFNSLPNSIKESFTIKIPRIPYKIINHLIAFYRHIYDLYKTEVYVDVFFDPETERFFFHVPKQEVSPALAHLGDEGRRSTVELSQKYIRVLECHSHNTMTGRFSSIDDSDQKYLGILHFVIGNIYNDNFTFELRMTYGDKKVNIPMSSVFEGFDNNLDLNLFPDWEKNVVEARTIQREYAPVSFYDSKNKKSIKHTQQTFEDDVIDSFDEFDFNYSEKYKGWHKG